MATKILILGASGFIGTNLVEYFASQEDYEVYAHLHTSSPCYNAQVQEVYGDLRERHMVQDLLEGMDIVINAAAVTSGSKDIVERPWIHVTDNAIMNSLVFQVAHEQEVKHVIFLSCTVMYQPKDFAQTEENWDANTPIYPTYFGVGNMKVYCEKLCEFYSRLGKTKYTALRHSNVYGPYDKFDLEKGHMLAATIMKVVNSQDVLHVWGSGMAKRDLIYVDDLVDAIHKCIDKQTNPFELFNIGAGKAHSILEIIKLIKTKANKLNLKLQFDATKPDIPTTVVVDCEKAKNILEWTCQTELSQGIEKTLEWYKKQ